MRVSLQPGIGADDAIAQLELIAVNAWTQAAPTGISHPVDRRNQYLKWAVETERVLSRVLPRRDAAAIFENPRHRDVCVTAPGDHLLLLVNAEIEAKREKIQQMAGALTEARNWLRGGVGTPVTIDTNILLQYQRPDAVNWTRLVSAPTVRLIVPLRVVEEVDAKKYDEKERLRQVARGIIPWLEGLVGDHAGPARLRDDTTLEVLLEEAPRRRPADADEEILAVASHIQALAAGTRLVTGDGCMRLRARALSLRVTGMDNRYLRVSPPAEATQDAEG
jgi:hypothetical protein